MNSAFECCFPNQPTDTLLNVFLAIAVDNLANAQILSADEENERLDREKAKLTNKEKFRSKTDRNAEKWRKAKASPVVIAINHFMKKNNADGIQPTSPVDQPNTDG